MKKLFPWAGGALLVLASACSGTFRSKACSTDDDCGGGLVCLQQQGQSTCAAASSAPIRIGMSAPVSGPSQELGTEMKEGVTLAFDAQNAAGGVRGRKLQLEFRDDEYRPDLAEAATRDLLNVTDLTGQAAHCPTTSTSVIAGQTPVSSDALARGPNAVLALLGNVGTPTMVRSAPIAVETGTLFFGAFTGATRILRDTAAGPCNRYIFNVRASYAQEARATLEYFFTANVPDAQHLISFDQNDTFGQAGYDGLVGAYIALRGAFNNPIDPANPITRFRYDRDVQTSVGVQADAAITYLQKLLQTDTKPHAVGIFMTDTYGPATEFITRLRTWQYSTSDSQQRLTITFSNVSFVGPNSLAGRLRDAGTVATIGGPKPFTDGVLVSQVVPNYDNDTSDAVVEYRKRIQAAGAAPSFTSLEGYIAARVFISGLLAHTGPLTPTALVDTFEKLPNLSLGLGASSGFSADSHNYSKSVWGTSISPDGQFQSRYFWSDGTKIQLFE